MGEKTGMIIVPTQNSPKITVAYGSNAIFWTDNFFGGSGLIIDGTFFWGDTQARTKNNGMVLCELGIQDTGNPWEIHCMLMFLSTRPDIIGLTL